MVPRQLSFSSQPAATLTSRSTHLRTFIALKPEANIIRQLVACIDGLQGCGWSRQVRWTADSNLHMTLRFIGNTDTSIVADLLQDLSSNCNPAPIPYEIDNVLIFRSAKRPSVIAATVADNAQLNELVRILETLLQSHGFAAESKSFRGHFTLGRCRRGFPKGTSIDYPVDPIRSEATQLVLYQSDTRPSGAVYTSLGSISL